MAKDIMGKKEWLADAKAKIGKLWKEFLDELERVNVSTTRKMLESPNLPPVYWEVYYRGWKDCSDYILKELKGKIFGRKEKSEDD